MSYSLEIRSDALADIDEAATWYEEREPGLGVDFARTIREAIGNLPTNPLAHRVRNRRRNVRWLLPSRFPFRGNVAEIPGNLIENYARCQLFDIEKGPS